MAIRKEIPIPLEREITRIEPNSIVVRGVKIEDLIREWNFSEVVWFLIKGEAPHPRKGKDA